MENVINAAEILFPDKSVDLTKWACVACDQFTSEPEYWRKLAEFVGDSPSALKVILPEIYLDKTEEKVPVINATIEKYLKNGTLKKLPSGYILTVRKTPFSERRIGIVAALDLNAYDFAPFTSAPVRATEGTIKERIPPRLKIRENAAAEFPHVLVLYDDEKREIAEKLYENRDKYQKLYDFPLNMGGGSLQGYFIPASEDLGARFNKLLEKERLIAKYGKEDGFLFAVGDGNHSLATAKTHWEKIAENLSEEEKKTHPARYALAEFVNVYDEGITFHPIFRYVKGVDPAKFTGGLTEALNGCGYEVYSNGMLVKKTGNAPLYKVISDTDAYIKDYIKENGGEVDYVHGEKNLFDLVDGTKNAVGILFAPLDKGDLFRFVSKNGPFPKTTFSMGEGVEKRYYLEGRTIK